jgi:hypothetical protein
MVDEATIIDLRRASARERKARSRAKQIKEFRSPPQAAWYNRIALHDIGAGKMPYSMKNLMGGGVLDKLAGMERGLAAASRAAASGGRRVPLDYTIVKFGDVEARRDGVAGASVSIRPGDASDGGIGPRAAANVLLQATAYQPNARNA